MTSIVAVLNAVFFAYLALTVADLALIGRIMLGMGVVASVAWAGFAITTVRRGTLRLKTDEQIVTGLVWTFLVVMVVGMMLIGQGMDDTAKGTQLMLVALTFLALFGHQLPMNRINRAELNLREDLMRLRLQIADMLEQQNEQGNDQGDR